MEKAGTVIALGMFDGVHIGHRRLLDAAKGIALSADLFPMVYTFSNHPMSTIDVAPKYILSRNESFARIRDAGVNTIVADEFNASLRDTEPLDFVKMLITRFSMREVVVGFNYTFGARAKGNASFMRSLGETMGFNTRIVPEVLFDGSIVSSSRIRHLIETGDIVHANAMLQVPYSISGMITKGKRIGSKLGFPTANIDIKALDDLSLPQNGVYATAVLIGREARMYRAVTNVGVNPTVGGGAVSIETHIIDFSREIYGETLKVEFYKKLRDEVRFKDKQELSAQIARDVDKAHDVFNMSFKLI